MKERFLEDLFFSELALMWKLEGSLSLTCIGPKHLFIFMGYLSTRRFSWSSFNAWIISNPLKMGREGKSCSQSLLCLDVSKINFQSLSFPASPVFSELESLWNLKPILKTRWIELNILSCYWLPIQISCGSCS